MTRAHHSSGEKSDAIRVAVFEHVHRMVPEGLDCELTLDTSLYDVGLDSLTRMNVLNSLEETFGLRFSEQSLYDMETCRDLVEYIGVHTGQAPVARPAAAPAPESPPKASSPREIGPEQCDPALFPECLALGQRLSGASALGLDNPFFRTKEQVRGAKATVAGREVVSYTSFDYLGLGGHPQVIAAAKKAIDTWGTSASASRLVGGNHSAVERLDEALARFLGVEAAVVIPSGYGTNASVFGHLFGPEDLILYDDLAHNSIVQGSLLSKAQRRSFPHNDIGFLDRLLRDVRDDFRRVVVAVEGVYSMDGDYPDLPQLLDVKRRHQAILYVDEAHSLGVLGATGRGICEHFGVNPGDGDLWMGTISKSLASGGGYLAGRRAVVQYLKYTLPASVFATGISPANAAAALAALEVLEQEPQRVARLRQRSQLFLQLAREAGLNSGDSRDTAVVPVILGNSVQCIRVSAELLRKGFDAQPILYPAVPESKSRIRFFITAEHTEEQIRHTVQALTECLAAGE